MAELRDELSAIQRESVSTAQIQRAVALFDPVWDLLLVPNGSGSCICSSSLSATTVPQGSSSSGSIRWASRSWRPRPPRSGNPSRWRHDAEEHEGGAWHAGRQHAGRDAAHPDPYGRAVACSILRANPMRPRGRIPHVARLRALARDFPVVTQEQAAILRALSLTTLLRHHERATRIRCMVACAARAGAWPSPSAAWSRPRS
jgi:hypothetical protein